MKKYLSLFLAVVLLVGLLPLQSSAQVYTGSCGENLTWTFDSRAHEMVISGTGPMYDYSPENPAPWAEFNGLSYCYIRQGVTSIGNYAFVNDSYGSIIVHIPSSVRKIGEYAFAKRRFSITFYGDPFPIPDSAFLDCYGTCYYLQDWPEAERPYTNENIKFRQAHLEIGKDTKQIYQLAEELNPADLDLHIVTNQSSPYIPVNCQVDNWDTATIGMKTVTVTVDGTAFTYDYLVTDGKSHLDMVEVSGIAPYQEYIDWVICPEPVVTAGTLLLENGRHYRLSYENNIDVGSDALVLIDGIGQWEDLHLRIPFRIVKRDISDSYIAIPDQSYTGEPLYPQISLGNMDYGEDYLDIYTDNIDFGTANCTVVGIGNNYGSVTGSFEITDDTTVTLRSSYVGTAYDETITGEPYYMEAIVAPGAFTGMIHALIGSTHHQHLAYYELYHMVGDTPVLVTTHETPQGRDETTAFYYDFSDYKEPTNEYGYEIFLLSYTWMISTGKLYAGVCVLYVPSTVPDATSMLVTYLDNGDFRKLYFSVYGLDENQWDAPLENISWASSNPSVATVENGIATFLAPGTTTITVQAGELSSSFDITVEPNSLSQCEYLGYDHQSDSPALCMNNIPLIEGLDYTVAYLAEGNDTYMEITGTGLFEGTLRFLMDPTAKTHDHIYQNTCDPLCSICGTRRSVTHTFGAEYLHNSDSHWNTCLICGKDSEHVSHKMTVLAADTNCHWMECADCGFQGEKTNHTFSLFYDNHYHWNGCTYCVYHEEKVPHDKETGCDICLLPPGGFYEPPPPGDVNGDGSVNNKDATRLLQYLSGWNVEVNPERVDVNGDGSINNKDATRLLQYLSGWDVVVY